MSDDESWRVGLGDVEASAYHCATVYTLQIKGQSESNINVWMYGSDLCISRIETSLPRYF